MSGAPILLRVTSAFGLFIFIDELLQLIQFARMDVLKRDPERVLSDPLDLRIPHRNRFFRPRNDESHRDHLAGKDFKLAVELDATD